MNGIQIDLLHYTPLWLVANAIRHSHANHDKSDSGMVTKLDSDPNCETYITYFKLGSKDKQLVHRVGNKLKHKSVLEQAVIIYDIYGISRACLQELSRHRTFRLTVKSTRYTLKELVNEAAFTQEDKDRAAKYVVLTGNDIVDAASVAALENMRKLIEKGISNDVAKYALPECFKTSLQLQVDLRNFQNFLELRLDSAALWEIRQLAYQLAMKLPDDYKYLVVDIVKEKMFDRYMEDNWGIYEG